MLSAIGAAIVPGITAGELAGSNTEQAWQNQVDKLKGRLGPLDWQISQSGGDAKTKLLAQKSAIESQIASMETSINQFRERQKEQNKKAADTGDSVAHIACVASGGEWKGGKCVSKSTSTSRTKTASYPLSGLLAGTEVAKLAEYDRMMGLLVARFKSGKISAEMFQQAQSKLFNDAFAKQIQHYADDLEFMVDVEKDGAETAKEWAQNLRDLANVDMGKLNDLLKNTDFARLKNDQEDMILLTKAFTEGIKDADGNIRKLSEAEYLDAVKNRLGLIGGEVEKMSTFAENAAKNIQDSFADFLFNPFEKGLKGMLQGFGQMIQKMIAEAVAADLAKRLFGSVSGGTGSGMAGGILGAIGGLFGFANGGIAALGKPLPTFAGGGVSNTAAIFGEAGPEAAVPLPDGRSIPVTMKGGGNTIIVNVSGNNAPDVRRAAAQGAREGMAMLNSARRYA
jgi:hypothetical protein